MSEHSLPGRRDFLTFAVGSFVIATLPALRGKPRLTRQSRPMMGSTAEIAVVHRDVAFASRALQAAFAELKRIEQLMTRFSDASDIGRANRFAGQRVAVSQETARVVERALAWADATDGAFDPAVARLVKLWDVTQQHTPPLVAAVQRLAGRKLYRQIEVASNRRDAYLFVREPDAAIDLGGIAAGYGVDRAVQVLREWGIRHGYVNVSGDIYALGNSLAGDPWQVGVRSPSDPEQLIGKVHLSDAAVTTSGDYEQGFDFAGRRYHHIMDPRTAAPRLTRFHSVTITAPTCLEADAASTAVFGWDADAAQTVLNRCSPGAQLVNVA